MMLHCCMIITSHDLKHRDHILRLSWHAGAGYLTAKIATAVFYRVQQKSTCIKEKIPQGVACTAHTALPCNLCFAVTHKADCVISTTWLTARA